MVCDSSMSEFKSHEITIISVTYNLYQINLTNDDEIRMNSHKCTRVTSE